MKHAILEAGAVGGLVGAALAHEGDHVTLLVRPRTRTQHSGMLRASSRTNEERNVIALVGKCCSDEPAHRAGFENGVLHDTPSRGEPPDECSACSAMISSLNVRLPA